jgi:hypothetical protein
MAKFSLAVLFVCASAGCIGAEPSIIEVERMYDPEPVAPTQEPVAHAQPTSEPAPTQPIVPEQSKPVETTSQPASHPFPVGKEPPAMAEPVEPVPAAVEPAAQPEATPVQPAPAPAPEPVTPPAVQPAPVVPEPAPVTPAPAPAPEPVTPVVPPAPAPEPAVCRVDECEPADQRCTPPQTGAATGQPGASDAGSWSHTYTLDSVTDYDYIVLPFMMRTSASITMKVTADLQWEDGYYRCNSDDYLQNVSCGAGTAFVAHKGCFIVASEFTVTCSQSQGHRGNLLLTFHQPADVNGYITTASRCEYTVAATWH